VSDDGSILISQERSAVAPAASRSFVGHARLIGALTLLSRLLGLAREVIAAHFFGDGRVWSAFTVAFTIPNLFRKLFGEGALSAAFIPLYAQSVKNQSPEQSNRFAAASVQVLLLILLAITLVGELVLWGIGSIWDMRPDRMLMLRLTAIMLPYVVLVCGAAFLGAILQVHHRFGPAAAAPVLLNIVHILVIATGARILMLSARADSSSPQVIASQTTLSYWLATFVLVAGLLQLAMMLPSLAATGFRMHWVRRFWTPQVKDLLRLSLPVALGAGVLQLSVLLDRGISFILTEGYDHTGQFIDHFNFLWWHNVPYPMEQGAPARLGWAQYLYQFPLAIFATSLATAIFPRLSSHALDADRAQFKATMRHGIEMTLLEGLPASLGLIIVRYPAVRLLFEHGQFDSHATELVVRSVLFYSAAIWAFSLQQILNRAFYALRDMTTPLLLSAITLGVNLAVELPLIWTPLREAGMAAGTAASFIVQSLVMLAILNHKVGGLGLRQLVPAVLRMLLASAVMLGACWGLQHLPFYPQGNSRLVCAVQLGLLLVTGVTVYFGTCALLGVKAVAELIPARWRAKMGYLR
jgi:putative peptidoglycan lipid II flippase